MVFLAGEVQDPVYFKDLDTWLEYSEKIKIQDLHQRVAGDKIYIKVYCVPKGGEKKWRIQMMFWMKFLEY